MKKVICTIFGRHPRTFKAQECFGDDAHAAAIRACSDADPAGVAWGAFQAWGDPEFRLKPPAA